MPEIATCTATEVFSHRRLSPVGTVQRHYRLGVPLFDERGGFLAVVVVPADTATFIYPADPDGEIADFLTLGSVRGVTDPVEALRQLGYRALEDEAA